MNITKIYQLKAAAGSGKTYALVTRFLILFAGADQDAASKVCCTTVAGSYSWHEVLAVTFTNKAATEMRDRVLGALKAAALGRTDGGLAADWTQEQASRRLDEVLWRFSSLGIRTIDSLLVQLIRLFSLELGLSPDLEPIFSEELFFEDLYDTCLEKLYGDSAGRDLLTAAVHAALAVEQRKGMWMGTNIKAQLMYIWRERLAGRGSVMNNVVWVRMAYQKRHAALIEAARALTLELTACCGEMTKRFFNFLNKCERIDLLSNTPRSIYAIKPNLEDCVNKNGRERLTLVARERFAAFKAQLAPGPQCRDVLRDAISLAPLVGLADRLLTCTLEVQRARSVSLASTWSRLVRDCLDADRVTEAFCRLGSRLIHILIDEFQDTSRTQWAAIQPLAAECLAHDGSLLYVGDIKQAIYGWRGGDAQLFEELGRNTDLTDLGSFNSGILPYNWRSGRTIVACNNAFFGGLSQPAEAMAMASVILGQDAYTAKVERLAVAIQSNFSEAIQDLPCGHQRMPGFVRCVHVEVLASLEMTPDATGSSVDLEISSILRKDTDPDSPYTIMGSGIILKALRTDLGATLADCLARGYHPRDITILVRSNRQATLLAGWLISLGLPVTTEKSLLLAVHPLIQQLVAWLRFLDYPLDNLSFWQFVSGQEVFGSISGLDLKELTNWLVGLGLKDGQMAVGSLKSAGDQSGPDFLYQYFQRDFPQLWEHWIAPFLHEAGLITPYTMIKELCDGYRLWHRWHDYELFLRRFLELLYQTEVDGCHTPGAFLEVWDRTAEDEHIPQVEGQDAVRIMTIHKAKGLQFPVVLVPFHNFHIRPDSKEFIEVYMSDRPVLVPLTTALGEIYDKKIVQCCLEALNLVYVAWTRPESELYLWIDGTAKGLQSALSKRLAILGFDPTSIDFKQGERLIYGPPVVLPTPGLVSRPAVPSGHCLAPAMAWLLRLKVFRHPLTMEAIIVRRRGELAHRSAQLLNLNDLCPDVMAIATAVDHAVAAACAEARVGEMEQAVLKPEISVMLHWLIGLPDMPTRLITGLRERELLAPDGSICRPDLLVLGEKERVVVEYKTGAYRSEHRAQLTRYLELVAALPKLDDGLVLQVHGLIVYLDSQEVVDINLP
ncbi:putative DNA helicase [Desulfovibrionales bacterium]